MLRTSSYCEPLDKSPGVRRSARKSSRSDLKPNEKNVELRDSEMNNDLTLCVLCHSKIQVDERRFLKDIIVHYTQDYIRLGAFPPPISNDENWRQYTCPREGCSVREMKYREYCIHEGIAHCKTEQIMANDTRPGVKNILSWLYPMKKEFKADKSNPNSTCSKEIRHDQQKDIELVEQPKLKRKKPNIEDKSFESQSQKIVFRSSMLEEEDIDDPFDSSIAINDYKKAKIELNNSSDFDDDPYEELPTPNLDKLYNCFICDGRGRGGKDGRNYDLRKRLTDFKYHLANCYYQERKLFNIIDAGPLNRNEDGSPIEDIGSQFRYRCPFPTCENNAGRGGQKVSGYKEYAIHLADKHHILEVVMAGDTRSNAAEVRAAIILARRRVGEAREAVPKIQVEEVHTCRICNGENKEGKHLSLDQNKMSSLRYHYANCYYSTGVYSDYFPLDEQNRTEDGKAKDALGTRFTYTCPEKKCNMKRKMGYKEFCIHTANEHGVVVQIMLDSDNEEIRNIGRRLKTRFG